MLETTDTQDISMEKVAPMEIPMGDPIRPTDIADPCPLSNILDIPDNLPRFSYINNLNGKDCNYQSPLDHECREVSAFVMQDCLWKQRVDPNSCSTSGNAFRDLWI